MNFSISAMPNRFVVVDFINPLMSISTKTPSNGSLAALTILARRAVCLINPLSFFAESKLLIKESFADTPDLKRP